MPIIRWSLLFGCLASGWVISYQATIQSNRKTEDLSRQTNDVKMDSSENAPSFLAPPITLNLPPLDDSPNWGIMNMINVSDHLDYWRKRHRQATDRHFPFSGPLRERPR